jgi:tripartite-type tricarboxylate transporter receptor subunit TctC
MKKMKPVVPDFSRRNVLTFALATGALAASGALRAQTARWPQRAVRIIVPFPAGGGYDFMARNLAQRLTETLGQPVVVENRAGANGNVGSDAVAKSVADGYTLLLGGVGPQALSVAMYPKLPYDPQRDFQPVSLLAGQPSVLVVHPTLPVKSLAELIAYAKANPGKLSFGSTGNGSGQHFGLELLRAQTGIDAVHIPYKGAAPLHAALLAGEVTAGFNIVQLPMPHVRRGELRVLATASKRRSVLALDVPTLAELGYPIDFDTWYALYAPAGTSPEIVALLNAEVVKALAQPQLEERANTLGIELIGSSPEQLAAHMKAEITRWVRVAKTANMKID